MAINLRKITQGERGTLTFTWEFPEVLTIPASILGETITATMTDEDGVTTAVSGTLTGTAATTCTWALSAGDSGTPGTFTVVFQAIVTGVTTYTLEATLEVIANPAVTGTQNDPLVSISAANAAWVTAGKTAVADGADLANVNDVVAKAGDTMTGPLTTYAMQYTTIPAGETVTIPTGTQMLVAGGITVDGTLVQDGPLVVIPDDALSAANDLSDLNDAATARTNLGLGSAATANTSAFDAAGTAAALVDDLSGVTDAATARTNLGLGTMATAAAADYILKDAAILSKSAGYQLAAGDEAKIIECNGTFTITLPNGLDAGFQATIVNVGSGTITLATATTLQSAGTQLATQYTAATVYHRGSNIWIAFGRLT